jgi:hypothetical protein
MRIALGFVVVAIGTFACSSGTTDLPHPLGSTQFDSQPVLAGGNRGSVLTAGAQSANQNSGSAPRAITEADIYKASGSQVFVLNQYRGLEALDLTNPSGPKLLSRVPILGVPLDLYLNQGTAYVAVSDYFEWGFVPAGGAEALGVAQPTRGSVIWAVDESDPSAPVVLSQLPIEGEVQDTRIVGNILYVVSRIYSSYWASPANQQDLTFVASFDVTDPKNLRPVDRRDFPASGWDTHTNVTQTRITLSQSGWDGASGTETTNFRVVDISDPGGKLAVGTTFSAPGQVQDRWAMDYDDATGVFRALVASANWNAGGTLHIWSSPTPDAASAIGNLDMNLNEQVTTAAFDGSLAYVVTSRAIDPLFVIDTSNPQAPVLEGSVSMPGTLDFIEPRGNRLIAFGHGAQTQTGSGLTVSLFDVSNPQTPAMLSRVDFGSGWTEVAAQPDDYRKVFQVLDTLGLIVVPYQSWDSSSWQYQGGTQLVDFTTQSLTLRGFAPHAGAITRAFPLPNAANTLAALSDQSFQVLDISNQDQPAEQAVLDLARPVATIALVSGKAVELSGDWYRGDTRLVVTDESDPNSPTPLAQVKVPAPYARQFQDGNILWILAADFDSVGDSSAWLQAIDVSNPLQPVQRGKIVLDRASVGYWGWGWYDWGFGDEQVLVGHTLAIHRSFYEYWCAGCQYQNIDEVQLVDLSNPDAPALGPTVPLPQSGWSWGLTPVGNFLWLTHFEWDPASNGDTVHYYVDRIDVSTPSAPKLLAKVNVPGVFFGANADGSTVYTEEVRYDPNWTNPMTWLHALTLSGDVARLTASTSVQGYAGGAVLNGNFAYLGCWQWNNSLASSGGGSYETLATIDLRSMHVTNQQSLSAQWAWIMKAQGGRLFLSAGWDDNGLLVYDLSNPAAPLFQSFSRTQGWITDVVVDGSNAFVPSGPYGVSVVALQ